MFEPNKLKWIQGASRAVKAVNNAGYFAFVITNQSGVARGLFDETQVRALHKWMADELAKIGARIDAFEYCPHHPDALVEQYRRVCHRRKPAPGMIADIVKQFPVDISRSMLIGDKNTDMEAASAAGLRGHLFKGGDLEQFVKTLLRDSGRVEQTFQ